MTRDINTLTYPEFGSARSALDFSRKHKPSSAIARGSRFYVYTEHELKGLLSKTREFSYICTQNGQLAFVPAE